MDESEQVAQRYLKQAGFTEVIYEPDGNVPPDFLCDGRVAVEVRRLNQLEVATSGKAKGLEETAIPLLQRIRGLFNQLGAATGTNSWFVFFRFARPIPNWKELGPMLRDALDAFRNGTSHERTSLRILPHFEIEVFRASKVIDNQFFVLGGYSDRNSGGWLLAEVQSSLRICIGQKTSKIAAMRHKYPQWWLVLVDHIGYGLSEFDRELFSDQVKVEHTWDKVVLVDPRDASRSFDI